jgi:hypothetical protein
MSQTHKILTLLKTNGSATNVELNRIAYRYSARIAELRKEGHDILTERLSEGIFRYTYKATN